MGGLTPILKLPYPTGSDRVADGDNAMQALALAVEKSLDPGPPWIEMALINGWTSGASPYGPIVYRRDALGTVHIQGQLANANVGTGQGYAFVMPVGYRPPTYLAWYVTSFLGQYTVSIELGGQLGIIAAGNSSLTLNVSYSTRVRGA